jgi:hypothetical protein
MEREAVEVVEGEAPKERDAVGVEVREAVEVEEPVEE